MKILGNKKIFYSWMWVVIYSIIIFFTVPVALTIQRFVAKHIGKNVFIYFVLSVVGFTFLFLLYLLIFKFGVRSLSNYVWLFVLSGLYSYFILKLSKSPAEALHFLEYGLLGFLLFGALKFHVQDKSIYFTATLICMLVGTFDEIIQWITPNRFWSFHDVWLNTLSGGLFLLALWKVIKPKQIFEKINSKSTRFLSTTAAVCILLLGLCASNTPSRVAYYTNLIPRLSSLQKEEPMSEYGYKIKDPEIGVIHSRFKAEELKETDKQKGDVYAQELNNSVKMNYKQFIREYNPISNPFLHELRVHVYHRNTNFNKGKDSSDLEKKREFLFAAYKENLILEKYFTQTITKSAYAWDEKRDKEVEGSIDKSKRYKSTISSNFFTSFSERTIWITIIIIMSIVIVINLIIHLKEKQFGTMSP